MSEREIVAPVAIADAEGRLARDAIGWARHPVQQCALAGSRVVRFDYWCLCNGASALTLLFADVGFLGAALVSFLDFSARRPKERVAVQPGGLALADTPRGDVSLAARGLRLSLRNRDDAMHVSGEVRTLLGTHVAIDLVVERPRTHETVNVLVPWDDTHFHFTSKQQALPVRGTVAVGRRVHRFADRAFACMDFGRGRYPASIDWCWGFAAGRSGARTLGFNLGGKWTDGTGVTENALVIDGRVHKIADAVDFTIARRGPWRVRTRTSDRVDLRFEPLTERAFAIPLGICALDQRMGKWSGTVVDDAGEAIAISDVVGLAESFRGRFLPLP
jgi:hypothetical protein